jgi:F0F1-type ATP synthase alpha subunit
MALSQKNTYVDALLFGDHSALKEGDLSRRTNRIICVVTGLFLRGHFIT